MIRLGKIVHYVMLNGLHRPAIVVHVWAPHYLNLQVFTDSLNDGGAYASGLYWATSVVQDQSGGVFNTWHFPEEVDS